MKRDGLVVVIWLPFCFKNKVMRYLKAFLPTLFAFYGLFIMSTGCGGSPTPSVPSTTEAGDTNTINVPPDTLPPAVDSSVAQPAEAAPEPTADWKSAAPSRLPNGGAAPAGFTNVATLRPDILMDIRYATTNNFTQSRIYDCPKCLLRTEAAQALSKAHDMLKAKGLGGLKMYDCYRPAPYQQRLWNKVPNPNYVTPPSKGSMHSRGAAVDLTVVDVNGKELDMGTPYDYFGKEAHTDYTRLSPQVLNNRKLLQTVMQSVGFEGIRTEWWHFSYRKARYPLSDYMWECE